MSATVGNFGTAVPSNPVVVSQTNFAWATLLDVGPPASGRLHDRLAQALRTVIRDGRLAEGAALPPSRALAEELGCSRWVVTEAYGRLTAEGYLAARVGSATRVSWVPDVAPHPEPPRGPATPPVRYDLSPGLPDLRAFPRRRWAEAVRAVVDSAVHHDLGLPDPAGHAAARTTVAQYLRRSRGAAAHPSSVIICAGITDGLDRSCRALRAEGITDVAVEHPGWPRLRDAATSAGLRVHPVPVDENGLCVDDLARTPARAVVVGAAHQFPTGTVLSPARRARLVRWAQDVDGFVVEDDYDAEFRYDHHPVAVMQGMAPGRVFLLGSVSKTLSPALGVGWLVAPGAMAAALRAANPVAAAPPVLDQLALATFIDRGWYDAHLRAARRRYRTRRDLLVRTLTELIPDGRAAGTAAGLHILLHLPDGTDTRAVVRAAAAAGLSVSDLDDYRTERSADAGRALVLGYGNIGDTEIPSAVALLRDSLPG
ncbi:MocR-like pyridoxine biosynthesis transcription factor PdxR [Actinophytocola algeriensis]|uniref:GntR family transcriptional regulator/MocR family aminotransferase n=1 Tax=Actinophytocola algeriensis TaxID=1768010 RepID=A0A7W7QCA6_9PSEU|nr:PLP-dependent aminotransferase family protein [Actinophytocola algeriensis]MBB4910808.1 GntR family transcriptional regulator/MocR family aminotransferase [Actinophytocola algeriensis]MBE1473801.1 GntR family transcriptional regulator/MocR family aminotransferase [Actinophytocola algeriensis]